MNTPKKNLDHCLSFRSLLLSISLFAATAAVAADMKISEVGEGALDWSKALLVLEKTDILHVKGFHDRLPTNEIARLTAFVRNGGALVATGIDSQTGLTPYAGFLPEKIELVYRPDEKAKPAGRFATGSTFFTWPRFAREYFGAKGGIDVRGPNARFVKDEVWHEGRRICCSYRIGRGFLLFSSGVYDWSRLGGNLAKALEFQRFGLAFRSYAFIPCGTNDRHSLPKFGENFLECNFHNCLETNFDAQVRLDITTADGQTRHYWGNGGRWKNEDFGVRVNALFDLYGDCTGRLTVANRKTGDAVEIWTKPLPFPEYLEIETPFYRSSVSVARRESDIRLALKANVFAEDLAGRVAEVTLLSPYGEELARANVPFTGAPRVAFKLPLAPSAPVGTYTVRATMPRAPGAGLAKTEATFRVVDVKKHQVFVDQDGTLLRDGKPWFPIGFFHVWPEEIEDVATTGADFIQFWDSHSTLGPTGTLARIAAKGMKVVVEDGIWGMVVNTQPNQPEFYPFETDPAFLAREKALRDDPNGAIAMWYVADEPGRDCLPGMKRSNRHRREMDPDHPTFVCSTGDPGVGAEGDILGLDIYPRYNGWKSPLTMVSDAFDRARRYTNNRQSLILAGQAFGNKAMHGEEPEDVRAMAYLGLVHGARGILWYTWHDGGNQGVVFHPKTRETTTAVIGEIHTFAPALFVPNGRIEARSADGNVHALLCGDDRSGRYLLLVNASDDAVKTSLSLEALAGVSLEPLFGAPQAKLANGILALDLAGRATAVYRVK